MIRVRVKTAHILATDYSLVDGKKVVTNRADHWGNLEYLVEEVFSETLKRGHIKDKSISISPKTFKGLHSSLERCGRVLNEDSTKGVYYILIMD